MLDFIEHDGFNFINADEVKNKIVCEPQTLVNYYKYLF